jgi:hypothetical protein
MNTYSREALVIREDGTEISVTADLASYRNGLRTDWGGTLIVAPDGLQEMVNFTEGRIRFPDGQEAAFLRPDISDGAHTNRVSIIGQDEAPF